MPKFDRKRLARGTKLTPEQVNDPLLSSGSTGIASNINSAGLDGENFERKWGVFSVNLSIPYIEGRFQEVGDVFENGGDISKPFSIPFMLPPLQDSFRVSTREGKRYTDTVTAPPPSVILDEVSISVDQRGEPTALASQFLGAPQGNSVTNAGLMDFDNWTAMTMRASILSKNPLYLDLTTPYNPNTIWTVEAAYNQFAAQGPFVVKDIAKAIDPWKSLTCQVEFPDLAGKDVAVCNININMKFRHELVPRETGGSTSIQNCPPLAHTRQTRTLKSQDTLVVDAPAGDTVIFANDAGSSDGISDNLGVIDEALAKKFKGGADRYGEVGPVEEIKNDTGYFCMAVPLFSNRRNGGISPYDVEREPHDSANSLWDRRIIPITYPMTIHHVLLAYNWHGWISYPQQWGEGTNNQQQVPQTSTFTVQTGVGIGTGLKADDFTYEQVADLTMVQPNLGFPGPAAGTWHSSVVDVVKTSAFGAFGRTGVSSGYNGWDWDLVSVPIVGNQGQGFYTQGDPYYVGRSWTPTAIDKDGTVVRTNVLQGDGSERSPRTRGQEQWLEVRMEISDSAGLKLTNVASKSVTDGGQAVDTFISGYQGHWVYIIGKRFLT